MGEGRKLKDRRFFLTTLLVSLERELEFDAKQEKFDESFIDRFFDTVFFFYFISASVLPNNLNTYAFGRFLTWRNKQSFHFENARGTSINLTEIATALLS